MRNNKILIITNKDDLHPNLVIDHLTNCNYEIFRLNTDSLLTDYNFQWELRNNKLFFKIISRINNKIISSDDNFSIWERRFSTPSKIMGIDNEVINEYCVKECIEFLRYLRYFFFDHFFIGHPLYDILANSKMLQLKIAIEENMKVPDTLFSNIPNAIRSFSLLYEDLVIKSMCGEGFTEDEFYPLYTNKLSKNDIVGANDINLGNSVSFLQNYIPKEFELRVTVVCDEIFACKLDSQFFQDNEGKIDWRQADATKLKHSIYELPESINEFCRNYLKKMHLNFGCFDFIVTPDGEYIFLECNPNGQWYWIEEATGLPISKAISEALIRGSW